MRILLIGGSGLISTPITRFLLERGDDVVLYNRGQTPLRVEGAVRQVVGDRDDYPAFEAQIAALGRFDCVIDMICFTPAQAESAVRACAGRTTQFIFCSTVDVYSRPAPSYPYREDSPREAISDYGRNKAASEDIFLAAHARGGFAATIIRPAMTYGEGGVIVHTFGWSTTYLDRMRKGKPIVVHGDGQSLWVTCHVDDVARAFLAAIGNERAYGKAYHTAGDNWMTWNQFHAGVAKALGVPLPRLVHIPTDVLAAVAPERAGISIFNFQYDTIFDNSAARADLGFVQTIGWVEGVRRTVAWLDANRPIENSDLDTYEDRLIEAWDRVVRGLPVDG